MNTNLSTSYTALQTERNLLSAQAERGWQAEQAASASSHASFSLNRLSALATAIVTSVHQFVDPRGFAMKVYAANQRLNAEEVSVQDTPVIAPAPAETMPISEQPSGAVIVLPNLRPVAADALDSPAAA